MPACSRLSRPSTVNWCPLGRTVTCAETTLSMSSITSSTSTDSVASARASPSLSWCSTSVKRGSEPPASASSVRSRSRNDSTSAW